MDTPTEKSCRHARTRVVAKDKDSEYLECLDCGALLDIDELKEKQQAEGVEFKETLSDE